MNDDEKGIQLMEPLTSERSVNLSEMEQGEPEENIAESTGIFSIGPKKLAKVVNTDASHPSAPGRDD